MASTARYIEGDTNKVVLKFNPSYPIEKGDLVGEANGEARPASSFATQAALAAAFVGVADEKAGAQSGENLMQPNGLTPFGISVCTTGRFEFPCASQTFAPLQPIGGKVVTGACLNQAVAPSTDAYSIGLAWPSAGSVQSGVAVTRVVVNLRGMHAVSSGQ